MATVLRPGDEKVALPRRALVAGTVNAHSHSFQSLLRGIGDDLPFLDWRARSLYACTPAILRPGADGVYTGALFAFAEMALSGVTTVCDFFYLNDGGGENAERVIQAARDVGMRVVLARCFYDWPGAPAAFRERPIEAATRFAALHKRWADHDLAAPGAAPMVSIHAAPHSLHGASPEMIEVAVSCARAAAVPTHIHLSEEKYQVDESLARSGKRPLQALAAILDRGIAGGLGPDVIAVHGCWFDEGERALLAERRAALAWCPGSNMFLGDGITDVVDLSRRGVRVALGTDGGCSNSRVSVFDEMRTGALLQKVARLDGQAITAERAFHLGTAGGGEVLRLPVGRVAPGHSADLVALDLDDPSLWPEPRLAKNVVYSLSARAVRDVFVDGQDVVRDGRLTRVDLDDVLRRVRELTAGFPR